MIWVSETGPMMSMFPEPLLLMTALRRSSRVGFGVEETLNAVAMRLGSSGRNSLVNPSWSAVGVLFLFEMGTEVLFKRQRTLVATAV
jgi:hypothetical protein